MKPLIRKQIIKEWSKQSEEQLNSLCCPNCRNLLVTVNDNILECINSNCNNDRKYTKDGNSLLKNTTVLIHGAPYGKSSVMQIAERGFLKNFPITPCEPVDYEILGNKQRDFFHDAMMNMFRYNQRLIDFQKHIDNLKSERDKLPEYAQDSLDAIVSGYICGVDMASGKDWTVLPKGLESCDIKYDVEIDDRVPSDIVIMKSRQCGMTRLTTFKATGIDIDET